MVSRTLLSFMPRFGAAGPALSADLDIRVLGLALAVTAVATVLSGVAPALFAASVRPVTALKEQATSIAGGLGFRKALVVGQFALALILLIGAGLFARTLGSLRAQGPGFSTANLLMFRMAPVNDGYAFEETKPLVRKVLAEVQALPDVEHAGVLRMEMLRMWGWNNSVTVEAGRRFVTENLGMNAVTPGLFETLDAPITRGRDFDERDSREEPGWGLKSSIVNEEFAERYFPDSTPIGARLGIGGRPDTVASTQIVGVVKSFHSHYGLREPEPLVFFPLWEIGVDGGTFYVRSRGSPEAAARSIRAAVGGIDPGLTVFALRTIDDQLDRWLTTERMLATLAVAFAVVATFLAMIGLFGVLSFSAARRTREIGIRLALGARGWTAGALIVREAAVLAVAGLVIALPLAWALGRLVESQLFGVRPMDPVTIAGAVAVLVVVSLVASSAPARRAGTVSPSEALRTE